MRPISPHVIRFETYRCVAMMLTIPNILTFSRLALIPIFVLVFFVPHPQASLVAAILFCIAAITDWFDGFLARKLNQTSRFGAFLDPVADKLLVASALMLIAVRFDHVLITIPALIIVCREIAISALREWMAEVGDRANVQVGFLGKLKTVFQFIAVLILVWQPPNWQLPTIWAGVAFMYMAVVLTIWSMCSYMKAAWLSFK